MNDKDVAYTHKECLLLSQSCHWQQHGCLVGIMLSMVVRKQKIIIVWHHLFMESKKHLSLYRVEWWLPGLAWEWGDDAKGYRLIGNGSMSSEI